MLCFLSSGAIHLPPPAFALQGNTVPLEQATAKLQKTRRPDREQLAALLPELDVSVCWQQRAGQCVCMCICFTFILVVHLQVDVKWFMLVGVMPATPQPLRQLSRTLT
jgi:hypothetical protein